MKLLKTLMIITDVGFVLYWAITCLHLIPDELLFKDYSSSVLVHWNWSFLPLDLAISATGLTSLWLSRKELTSARRLMIVSLTLTFVSGLQAISFWVLAQDFSLMWWLPNLFLLLYPLFFLPKLIGLDDTRHA